MKNQLKILRHFIENKDKEFTIKQVSEELKLNYRIAYQETMALDEKKLVRIKKIGNSNICSFNYIFNEMVLQVENTRKDELLKNKSLKIIYKRIREIQNPLYILLIFGSYSTKTQTRHSDIDICLISDSKEIKRKVKDVLELVPLNIHFLDFTTKEFISMLNTRKRNVGHEILENNVILRGAEEFYELVNYAK